MKKNPSNFLKSEDFAFVIKSTPLISIDLCIVHNKKLLIGKRVNSPAKYNYFVPGGRIYKNEKIENAIQRIIKDEIGIKKDLYKLDDLEFIGIYEHFYTENFLETEDFNTHYIVMAYKMNLHNFEMIDNEKILSQHSDLKWICVKDHISEKGKHNKLRIHKYTENYFNKIKFK